jgi:CRP/FNR family transcriptional regulator, cyclic AMP receptor protein
MRPAAAGVKQRLNIRPFLSALDNGRIIKVSQNRTIFAQVESSDGFFFIRKGRVKLTIATKKGKRTTVDVLHEGDLLGVSCLAAHPHRLCAMTAMTDCSIVRVDKQLLIEALRRERVFFDWLMTRAPIPHVRYEEDLFEQVFNSTEKRLAGILLLLAEVGNEDDTRVLTTRISENTLAETIGTTRSRVVLLMTKFRKLGFIDCNTEGFQIHNSLLDFVLHN